MSALHEEEFQHKKVEWKTWKTLLQFVLKYKKILILMIASMSVMGVIEVLMPYLTSFAIDNYIVPRKLDDLWKFILLYVGAILATGGTVFTFVFFAGKMEVSVTHDIRENGFDRLQILSYSYYDVTSVGYIMARLTSDAQKLGDTMAWSLVDLAWGAFFMVASLVWMMILNLKLALIIVCLVPFLAVISFYFQQKILKHQREVRKTNSRITGAFNEGIMGARTTKTLVREEQNYDDFSGITAG